MSERQRIAGEIAGLIASAENAIDRGGLETARLNGALLQGRFDANLSAVVCPEVFQDVAAAQQALSDARARIVRAHGGLDRLRRAMRLQPTELSGSGDKSPYDSVTSPSALMPDLAADQAG